MKIRVKKVIIKEEIIKFKIFLQKENALLLFNSRNNKKSLKTGLVRQRKRLL